MTAENLNDMQNHFFFIQTWDDMIGSKIIIVCALG